MGDSLKIFVEALKIYQHDAINIMPTIIKSGPIT